MQTEHYLDTDKVGEVQSLKPETSGAIKITPETIVLCINRGREVYSDMFDSQTYAVQPGYFSAPYAAAKHFQNRAVVPGSRNSETGFQASFIAILGVAHNTKQGLKIVHPIDDMVQWDPFTDDECREYGHAVEALDRAALVDPIESDVELLPVFGRTNEEAKARAQSRLHGENGQANGRKATRPKPRIEGSGAALLKKGQKGDDELGIPATLGAAGRNEAIDMIRADSARVAQGSVD